MWMVIVGVVLIVLNLLNIGVVGTWNWQLFGDLWKFARNASSASTGAVLDKFD